jgi:hypothetical protein
VWSFAQTVGRFPISLLFLIFDRIFANFASQSPGPRLVGSWEGATPRARTEIDGEEGRQVEKPERCVPQGAEEEGHQEE